MNKEMRQRQKNKFTGLEIERILETLSAQQGKDGKNAYGGVLSYSQRSAAEGRGGI